MIPGLAAETYDFSELLEALGFRRAKVYGAAFVLHDDEIANEQGLSGSKPALFPESVSAGDVNAGEPAVIEAVEVTSEKGRAVELGFHFHSAPDFFRGELAVRFGFDSDELAAHAVAGGEENLILRDDNGL